MNSKVGGVFCETQLEQGGYEIQNARKLTSTKKLIILQNVAYENRLLIFRHEKSNILLTFSNLYSNIIHPSEYHQRKGQIYNYT